MAIDRLSSSGSLLAALRAELAKKGGRDTTARSAAPAPAEAAVPRRDVAALRRELAAIAGTVPEGDAAALDAARPRMVKAILLWEFGPELRGHGDWQAMVDTLVEALGKDPRHRQDLALLVRELRQDP